MGGFRITAPNSYTGLRYMKAGLYEKALSGLLTTLVRPGMTVLDLGANVGYYTIISSRLVGEKGVVYSFEPDPVAYTFLCRNILLNGCTNVKTAELGISNATGTKWFDVDSGFAEGRLTQSPRKTSTPVEVVSLDEYFGLRSWPSVDLVKMDVEGSEEAVLAGMRLLAKRNMRMKLIMEFSPITLDRPKASAEAIAASLQEMGYSRGYVIERRMRPFSLHDGLPLSLATYNLLFARQDANHS